jgi:hypothetical protein
VGAGAVGEAQMAAYVALLADRFESLSYPLAPRIQRPPQPSATLSIGKVVEE